MSTQTTSPLTGRKRSPVVDLAAKAGSKTVTAAAERTLAEAAKPEPKRPQSKRPSVQLGFVMPPEMAERIRKASKKDGMSAWLRAACELKLAQ